MKTYRIQHRHLGFTLVELLVVIVIIATLASIGFVAGRRVMDSASTTKTLGNVRQLTNATQMFSTDNNGIVLNWSKTYSQGIVRNWAEHVLVTLQGNLADGNAYKTTAGDTAAKAIGIFADPKALKQGKATLQKTGHNSWRTYAYNNRIGTNTQDPGDTPAYINGAKLVHQVEFPSKLILFSQRISSGTSYGSYLQPEDAQNGSLDFKLYNGSIMVAYFDGHVEMLKKANFPSKIGMGVNLATGKAFTETEWREYWWGRRTEAP